MLKCWSYCWGLEKSFKTLQSTRRVPFLTLTMKWSNTIKWSNTLKQFVENHPWSLLECTIYKLAHFPYRSPYRIHFCMPSQVTLKLKLLVPTAFILKQTVSPVYVNPLTTDLTKCSNTFKPFVGNSRQISWVCLTIFWGWRLKSESCSVSYSEPCKISKMKLFMKIISDWKPLTFS